MAVNCSDVAFGEDPGDESDPPPALVRERGSVRPRAGVAIGAARRRKHSR